MEHWKDIDVFNAIKEGDKEALSVLFLKYYDYLQHYGRQVTNDQTNVEECIQELFIYLFESYGRLGDVRNVKAYLFSSLRRRLIEKIQRQRRKRYQNIDTPYLIEIQFSPEDILFQKENQNHIRQALAQALNQLPARQKEAVYLRYYNNLSTKEIAEVMEVENQTILNTLHKALKKIRKNVQLNNLFGLKPT